MGRSAGSTCSAASSSSQSRPIALDLGVLRIGGRSGTPEAARARADQQYVYVNGRMCATS